MKLLFCLSVIWGCAFALPDLDWSKIKPNYVTVDPVPGAPIYPNSRVIGGTEATPNSLPYQAALLINLGSFCGGILISTQHVISAAHCTIQATIVQVILGAHNINQAEPTQLVVTSTQVVNHPSYNSATLLNDISVVILPNVVPTSAEIRPITLAPANSGEFAGSEAILSGWGRTSDSTSSISSTLQRVNLAIISNQACIQSYGSMVTASHICTSGVGQNGAVGGCNGDSGGPLVVDDYVVGAVSFGTQICMAGHPTVYTRISSYRLWLNEVTGI